MRIRSIAAAVALSATAAAMIPAGATAANGPISFEPIDGTPYATAGADWTDPFVIPSGFTQQLVVDETQLDIYAGADDLTDMNTVNETGPMAGRFLYRTHEVGSDGSLSVVDLKTGEAKVIAQREDWRRLDGLRWTPWGTLLFAEETGGGRLFEAFLDPNDPTVVTSVEERREVGILRHEGIEALGDGTVYVIDELNGGSIFKFVPTKRGDLSDGQLYALKLTDLTDAEQKWSSSTYQQKVGAFEWVALDMDKVVVDADAAADDVAATEFGRPEDVEVIGQHALRRKHVGGPRRGDRPHQERAHLVRREGRQRPGRELGRGRDRLQQPGQPRAGSRRPTLDRRGQLPLRRVGRGPRHRPGRCR